MALLRIGITITFYTYSSHMVALAEKYICEKRCVADHRFTGKASASLKTSMAAIRIAHTSDSNFEFLRYNVLDGAESDDIFANG